MLLTDLVASIAVESLEFLQEQPVMAYGALSLKVLSSSLEHPTHFTIFFLLFVSLFMALMCFVLVAFLQAVTHS